MNDSPPTDHDRYVCFQFSSIKLGNVHERIEKNVKTDRKKKINDISGQRFLVALPGFALRRMS